MGESEWPGWATDDEQRVRWERILRDGLVGRAVRSVRYVELRYDGHPGPMWGGPQFDALDFGLELDLDSGITWAFIWEQRGHNEGVLAYPKPLASQLRTGADAVWDVTDRWRAQGLEAIASVSLVWERHAYGPGFDPAGRQVSEAGESDLCLSTLVLHSPSGRTAVITLGERAPGGSYRYIHDNVAVFFSLEQARAARVPLPGKIDAL